MNLTKYLETEGKQETVSISYGGDGILCGSRRYALVSPFSMELVLDQEEKDSVTVSGTAEMVLQAECDRCLSLVEIRVPIRIMERFTQEETAAGDPDGEHYYLEGYELDTDRMIEDAAQTEFPVKILCREDCKGICMICGHNLNEGECGCDRFVPDPRMAAIGDLFAATKSK